MITTFEKLQRVQETGEEILSIGDVKNIVKISSSFDDDKILYLIRLTRRFAEDLCGIALIVQTYSVIYKNFFDKSNKIVLPFSPVGSIDKIECDFDDCKSQTLNEKYYCFDKDSQALNLNYNSGFDLLKITFTTQPDIHKVESFRVPLLQHIGLLYSSQMSNCSQEHLSDRINSLYSSYRILRI